MAGPQSVEIDIHKACLFHPFQLFEESGGLVRIGLAHYNTDAEVEVLLDALGTLRNQACNGR